MSATPTKRRALASLDLNVSRSPRSPSSKLSNKALVGTSPLKKGSLSRHATLSPPRKESLSKRPLEESEDLQQPAVKKLCSEIVTKASPSANAKAPEANRPKATTVEDAEEDEPSASQPTTARRSISPDASSLFDTTSVINTSQFTTITEPDTDTPTIIPTAVAASQAISSTTSSILDTLASLPPPRPRRIPTREEFRQKAEILKLRLSLATYKVKTNQTDVPLDKLQIRPVPGMARRRTPLPSMSAHTIHRATPAQYWYRSATRVSSSALVERDIAESDEEDIGGEDAARTTPVEKNALPKLHTASTVLTPRKSNNEIDEEKLTSSALRGGAAKGLLSLSQGSI